MKKRNLILILVGVVVGLCIICSVAAALTPSKKGTPTTPPNSAALVQPLQTSTEASAPFKSTDTPVPTDTNTPQPTSTPTPEPTETPLPPATQTALAALALQTEVAQNATATRQELNSEQTATVDARNATATQAASDKTATAEAINANRTATAQVLSAQATKIAEYATIPWKDLVTYPDKYKGQKVKVSGQVFNINGDTELQMWIGDGSEAVYVQMSDSFSDIYEHSWIIVYGTVEGENCGTNAFGGTVCQTLLLDAFYKLP
jgi:cytoskeletal protein RodZ